MAKQNLQIVLDVLYKGGGKLRQAENDLTRLDKSAAKVQGGFKNMVPGIAAAGVALGAVAVAGKAAYDSLGRGAALELATGQFERLAVSIDSTADAMLGRLQDATKGMMSDAELVASASQIMSLGLAKTEDAVVRLAAVSANLGWDQNQVILTMANDSVMRLDALGLSIDAVKEKQQKLQAAGMAAGDAFDLAVIEAGEEKYRLLGDTSETTAGKIKAFEASVKDAQDAFDIGLAAGFAEALGDIGPGAESSVSGVEDLTGALGDLAGAMLGAVAAQVNMNLADAYPLEYAMQYGFVPSGAKTPYGRDSNVARAREYNALLASNPEARKNYGWTNPADPSIAYRTQGNQVGMTGSSAQAAKDLQKQNLAMRDMRQEGLDYVLGLQHANREQEYLGETGARAFGGITSSIDEAAQSVRNLASESGSYFSQLRGQSDFNLAEAAYGALDKAGYSAGELAQFGVMSGLFDQSRANELLNQSFLMQSLDQMAGQGAGVGDLWSRIQAMQNGLGDDAGLAREFFSGMDAVEAKLGLNITKAQTDYDIWVSQLQANPPVVTVQIETPGEQATSDAIAEYIENQGGGP